MVLKRVFLLFLILNLLNYLAEAHSNFKFIRYTTKEKLCNNDILSICQDKYGYIWFGTKDGCSRFDGINFTTYRYDEKDSASLGAGWITNILKDKHERLWFTLTGTEKTLMLYDYENDKFIDYTQKIKHKFPDRGGLLSIWQAYIDNFGRLWLNPSNSSLFYIHTDTTSKNIDFNGEDLNKFTALKQLYEDNDSNLWIAASCLYYYNFKHQTSIKFCHNPKNKHSISSKIVSCVFQDSNNEIWIGTFNGLNKLIAPITDSAKFEKYYYNPDNKNSIPNNVIYDINEDKDNNLIIATVDGLCVFDKKVNKFHRFYKDEMDKQSISSNIINTLYRDKDKNIWIGTNSGVCLLKKNIFQKFIHSGYSNSLSHNKVEYLLQGNDSILLIASPKGIDEFNIKTSEFNVLLNNSSVNGALPGNPIIMQANKNIGFWIGTWDAGFSYYNRSSQKLINFINQPGTEDIKRVYFLYQDSKKRLWINSVSSAGVIVFNNKMEKIKHFGHEQFNNNSLNENQITTIHEDSNNEIWIGTFTGLNRLTDFKSGIFKHYLSGFEINKIIESFDKYIWVATNKGVFKLNTSTNDLIKYSKNNGIPGKICNITEDENHDFWVNTSEVFARFSAKGDSIYNVIRFREDGIIQGNCLPNSSIKLTNGMLAFGSTEGFFIFDPKNIDLDSIAPKIALTNLKIKGEYITVNEEINEQVVLDKTITELKHITLNYKNNAFTIEFAGIKYHLPQYNKYAYRLKSGDNDETEWNYTSSEYPQAQYMNLAGGEYIFELKAANAYDIWNQKPYKLKITILPPWWKTWWFIFFCIIALFLLIIFIIRIRTYQLHLQKQKLESEVKERTVQLQEMNLMLEERQEEMEQQANKMSVMTKELLQANTDLEVKTIEVEKMAKQLHEADENKLRFFANISHEFRTPLTLIINPLEKYLHLKKTTDLNKTDIFDGLKLMHKNANRLLRLINEIIDFRQIDKKNKKLNITNSNIVGFIEEIVNAFLPIAKTKGLHMSFDIEHLTFNTANNKMSDDKCRMNNDKWSMINDKCKLISEFWFDPDVMEKILYNLISNAIKYTPEGGEINIQLRVKSEELRIEKKKNQNANPTLITTHSSFIIKITDTGIGIKPENIGKIFDRFYREEKADKVTNEGSGIGLSYTKELVELHHGKISVESEPHKGCVFSLIFPLNLKAADKNKGGSQNAIELHYINSMIEDIEKTTGEQQINNEFDIEDSKKTILIAEDNIDLRVFIKKQLTENYNVYEAQNGQEGYEIAVNKMPDLIISDIMMPVMDGIELCEKLKTNENTSHIPVIFLTAKIGDENMIHGLNTGANDYLTKPFKVEILKIKVNNIFIHQKQLFENFLQSSEFIPSKITYSKIDDEFLQKAITIVDENMHNEEFDNEKFIEMMNYSRALVYRKLKAVTNQSVSEFIRSIKLKKALTLFIEGNDNISEVSYIVGYKSLSAFSKHFRQMFEKSPRQFILDNRKIQ